MDVLVLECNGKRMKHCFPLAFPIGFGKVALTVAV